MSYTCAGCKQHKEGKPEKVPTEIRQNGEVIQEVDYRNLVRVFIKDRPGFQIEKQEDFCPVCVKEVGEPKVVGFALS